MNSSAFYSIKKIFKRSKKFEKEIKFLFFEILMKKWNYPIVMLKKFHIVHKC